MVNLQGAEEMTNLSLNEAIHFLETGEMPEDYKKRVETMLELARLGIYWCRNCGSRLCMSCVMREEHEICENDCPFCCEDGKPLLGEKPPGYEVVTLASTAE